MTEGKRKTALVTGGAKGIGRVIAEAVARSGWDVAVCGRDVPALTSFAEETERATGRPVKHFASDLSKAGAALATLRAATSVDGIPDAIVCNAGDYGALGPLAEADFASWKASFDLNFFAVAELIAEYVRLALVTPATARRKIVVLGGSGLGGAKVWPGISAYSCAKAALYRLVEVLHEEVSGQGIDINCLAPGAVKTGITEQAVSAGAGTIGALYEASLGVRNGRGDSPQFAADAVVELLGTGCDGLSGRLISAKWDRDILVHPSKAIADADLLRLRRIDDSLFSRTRRT